MKTAPKPKHILPKAKFTESVLAHIIVSKFDDRQPYYHLEKQFKKRAGFDLSRSTMASATIKCTEALQPLVNLIKDEIIDYDWDGLREYLQDGRLEVDNNLTEQEIKPFVIARKNFMFANSDDGANALCLPFNLIRTAKPPVSG